MHEMSLAASLVEIVRQELEKHGSPRLRAVHVRCGALANVVPEALDLGFSVTVRGTALEGARLVLRQEPVRLACGGCGREFAPSAPVPCRAGPGPMLAACPACGEDIGHTVLSGKELAIENLEVE